MSNPPKKSCNKDRKNRSKLFVFFDLRDVECRSRADCGSNPTCILYTRGSEPERLTTLALGRTYSREPDCDPLVSPVTWVLDSYI